MYDHFKPFDNVLYMSVEILSIEVERILNIFLKIFLDFN